MSNYNASAQIFALYLGDAGNSFAAENPAAPQAGERFALAPPTASNPRNYGVQVSWAVAPTTASVDIQEAFTDTDADYATVDTISFATPQVLQSANYSTVAPFVRAKLTAQTGGSGLTVTFKV